MVLKDPISLEDRSVLGYGKYWNLAFNSEVSEYVGEFMISTWLDVFYLSIHYLLYIPPLLPSLY